MKNLNKTHERDFCVTNTNTEGEIEQRTLHTHTHELTCKHLHKLCKKIVGILK